MGELSYMIHGDKPEDHGPRTSSIAIFNHGEGKLHLIGTENRKPKMLTALNDFHLLKEACQHLHEQSDMPILVGYTSFFLNFLSTPKVLMLIQAAGKPEGFNFYARHEFDFRSKGLRLS